MNRYQARRNHAVKCHCHGWGIWDTVMDRWYDMAFGTEEDTIARVIMMNATAAQHGGS